MALMLVSSSCRLAEYAFGIRDGCSEWTHVVDFDSSNEILRGTWQGTAHDYPAHGTDNDLSVDLTATFVDARTYAVTGTFTLGTAEPLALDGAVDGRCSERYAVDAAAGDVASQDEGGEPTRASPPPPAQLVAEVRDASGVLVWTAHASWGGVIGGPPLSDDVLYLVLESEVDLGDGLPDHRLVEMSRMGSP